MIPSLPPPVSTPATETPKKEGRYKLDFSSSDDKSIFPKYFALQNYSPRHPQPRTAPFLQYIHESYLEFNGEHGLLHPFSKFESEISDSNPKLIHIRCTGINKYWVRKSSDSNHIVPIATKKEDNVSKSSCTLFEPIYDAKYKAYRFRHVQLGYELFRDKTDRLLARENGSPDSEREDAYGVFTRVIDWNSLCVFPKHVTFKGYNGKYLRFEGKYLQVSGEQNHSSLIHEIYPQKDGNLMIKNIKSERFWIHDPNWIVATARDGNRDDPNLLFQPVSLHNNVVALRSLGNTAFCAIISVDDQKNCLNATESDPTEETQFEVSEDYIIYRRKIDINIHYRLGNGRIYGERVWSMAKGYAINKTEEPEQIEFTFSFEDERNMKWTNIFAKQFESTKYFNAEFPLIKDGEITIGNGTAQSIIWGETYRKKKILMSCDTTITVPPMSKVKVNVVVKRGFCEVPFSYMHATTSAKHSVIIPYRDGVFTDGDFTGVNSYQFQITTDEEALPI
ncbi:uncharacterized protein LOC101208220 [Cucumis sativus]|uniref:uncharacterized protein LOC101208220 n=1 Tax=Cucumis sativus TaxID=3659 RepID=UPI0012F4DF56|nr:uncharacterized protein LOC101208220 [Cucumis sativus]KAE8646785.1 hypothetical protein Csa_005481 [Cucumis sativus]